MNEFIWFLDLPYLTLHYLTLCYDVQASTDVKGRKFLFLIEKNVFFFAIFLEVTEFSGAL
jgi:hypothetical protein